MNVETGDYVPAGDADQAEKEVSAIESIYNTDFSYLDDSGRSFAIALSPDSDATLRVSLPAGYPREVPPVCTLTSLSIRGEARQALGSDLADFIHLTFRRQCCLYDVIEKAKEFIAQLPLPETAPAVCSNRQTAEIPCNVTAKDAPVIFHGEAFTERRSTFQSHLALVKNVAEVKAVMSELKRNRKVAEATHNVMAYRISGSGEVIMSDCDDDGEAQAGGRLLHLLEIMKVTGVVVVVSRWFGGILLGPERFKHITNAARDILTEHAIATRTGCAK